MIIIVALVLLFIVFFFLRKNIGAALLATIAGLSVYEMFGVQIVNFLASSISNSNRALIEACLYLILVAAMPIVLYLRSPRGGLFGLMRIGEAALFAALLASLCSAQIAYFFPFDQTATEVLSFISSIKGWILAIGIGGAYLDILTSREV